MNFDSCSILLGCQDDKSPLLLTSKDLYYFSFNFRVQLWQMKKIKMLKLKRIFIVQNIGNILYTHSCFLWKITY